MCRVFCCHERLDPEHATTRQTKQTARHRTDRVLRVAVHHRAGSHPTGLHVPHVRAEPRPLNDLKNQEAALVTKKQDLENDIERWNDDSYVATQARERLGFVFPGEKAVRVQHPEAVTGTSEGTAKTKSGTSDGKVLPWYSELEYSFKKADERPSKTASGSQSGDTGKADGNSGSATDTNSATSSRPGGGSVIHPTA